MKRIIDIGEYHFELLQIAVMNGMGDNAQKIIAQSIPLDEIRDEIERLHYHPKLDFIKNDEVVDMILDIINKYMVESEEQAE